MMSEKKDVSKMVIYPRFERIVLEHKDKGRKITQTWLAEQLGVKPQAVSNWFTGANVPKVEMLYKIAYLLDCKTDDLYGIEWEEEDEEEADE
jgi:transcriptional regulator with XRE-family HTH domain